MYKTVEVFDGFAPWYNKLRRFKSGGGEWLPYNPKRLGTMTEFLERYHVTTVLDVACGTGNPAIGLAKKGFDVTCSDGSPSMVKFAQENVAQHNVKIDFHCCEWRNISEFFNRLGRTFDCVICTEHPLYYLKSPTEIKAVLYNFKSVIKDGGICYIDNKVWVKDRETGKLRPKYVDVFQLTEVSIEDKKYEVQISHKSHNDYDLTRCAVFEKNTEGKTLKGNFDFIGYPMLSIEYKKLMESVGFRKVTIFEDICNTDILLGEK